MNLNNISLPYPVLGVSDDILPELSEDAVKINISKDKQNYIFDIALIFENPQIQKYIDEGMAEYTCEYECSKTMLRKCESSINPIFHIVVGRKQINGRIYFNCFVLAKKKINSYVNKGFNADYKGYTFDLSVGDFLVAFPQYHYDADIKYDRLQAAGSFMQIREGKEKSEVFFDISGDKIDILLPTELYNMYNDPHIKGAAETMQCSLALNALTFALLNIKKRDNEERTWGKTIYYRLENEEGYSLEELEDHSQIPCLAQKLLKDPYRRLFNQLSISNPLNSDE